MQTGVSVLMPVHNGGRYLKEAVNSILAQSHKEVELILVDDHSTDTAIAELPPHQRLKVIKSPSRGIVAALNAGLTQAQFPYIARMDGDDVADSQRLQIQMKFLQDNPSIDICGAQVEVFRDNGELRGGYQHYQNWINQQCTPDAIARNFFVESCIPHPTALMHRDVLINLRGYADTSWPEDYDLWCRAHLAGYRFGKPSGKPLLRWRDHGRRASRVEVRYEKQQFLQCKAYYLSKILASNSIDKCMVWGTGPTGAKLHDYLEKNGIEVTGFVDINPKMKNGNKRDKPVHVISTKPTRNELEVIKPISIVAVSARGARDRIRHALVNAGLEELQHFILAA